MGKLSVFLLLMVLANLSRADVSTTNSPLNVDTIVTENLGAVSITEGSGDNNDEQESLVNDTTTENIIVTENATENDVNVNTEAADSEDETTASGRAEEQNETKNESLVNDTTTKNVVDTENATKNNLGDNTAAADSEDETTASGRAEEQNETKNESLVNDTTTENVVVTENATKNNLSDNTAAVDSEDETTASGRSEEQNNTTVSSSNDGENTTPGVVQENSTNLNNDDSTTDVNDKADTTTAANPASNEATTTSPEPVCTTPGLQAHKTNCQLYHECTQGSQNESLSLVTKSCPEKQAFNIERNRCSRDISSCNLEVECASMGTIADPNSNSSYYLCEPRLNGIGFYVFRVHCSPNEVYYALIGRCLIDLKNPPPLGSILQGKKEIKDINIVKKDLKQMQREDKLKLKQIEKENKLKLKKERQQKKAEEKLQKQREKEAAKQLKNQEKLKKKEAREEAAAFVCANEGNFASQVANNLYIACVNKKGKVKPILTECGLGATFNPKTGTCVNSATAVNDSQSEEENSISDSEEDD